MLVDRGSLAAGNNNDSVSSEPSRQVTCDVAVRCYCVFRVEREPESKASHNEGMRHGIRMKLDEPEKREAR